MIGHYLLDSTLSMCLFRRNRIRIQQSARDLGVVLDSRLSLSEHVASV